MSRAIFIENVAKKGKLSKAEAKRTVDLVLGEIEAGLKKSKKAGRYTIGNFGTFSIVKRKGTQGPQPADRRGDPHQGLQGPQIPPRRPTPQGCRREVIPARTWWRANSSDASGRQAGTYSWMEPLSRRWLRASCAGKRCGVTASTCAGSPQRQSLERPRARYAQWCGDRCLVSVEAPEGPSKRSVQFGALLL